MNTRNRTFGLGRALSAATVCLTFSLPTLAQTNAEKETETEAPSEAGSLGGNRSDNEETSDPFAQDFTPPPTEAPDASAEGVEEEPTDLSADDSVEEDGEGTDPTAPVKESDEDYSAEGELGSSWGIEQLSIIETPWSAYPSQQIRGITYGSLWRTFHGQQWPYMPRTNDTKKPTLQIGWSGLIWNDLSNTRIDAASSLAGANVNDQDRWHTQTRATLRMTPTLNIKNDWFVQGNAELVLQGDMVASNATGGVLATTDDLWVRFGKWNLFDVTVGRFQTWEIANHFGMALDYATLERQGAWIVNASIPKPTDGYGLDYFWDRQNYSLGGYAVHLYPTEWLRGELAGHIGAGNSSNAGNPKQFDIRPSVIFDIGWLKLKGGYEFGKATSQDETQVMSDRKNGWGFAAQFVFDPYVEFGASFARGYQDIVDARDLPDLAGSNTVQSVGGFINFSPGHEPLVLGAGAFLKERENFRVRQDGSVDTNKQWLAYGAVQYTLWKQLYLKVVGSHASNKVDDFDAGQYINNALSVRFRTEVLF